MSNVLLIQVDQMNHRCLSGLGNANIATPHLDALAAEGMLFTQARCNNPICLPSRVSMLSGRYCAGTHQYGFSGHCDSGIDWLPELFRRQGHLTSVFGKMHASSIGWSEWPFDITAPTLPEDQDFTSGGVEGYRDYCMRQGVPFPHDQVHGHDPFGKGGVFPSASDSEAFWMYRHSSESDVPLEHSLENWTTDRCCDFLRECAQKQHSFFTWLSYDRPHYPSCLPALWHQRAMERTLELPEAPDRDLISRLTPSVQLDYLQGSSRHLLGDEDFRFIIATYYTLIEYIDHEVGRVLQTLRENGLDNDTTVVFTSDHGDEAGYRGLYDKINGVNSEEIVRVPLILRPAPALKLQQGKVSHSPVELVDLYPTLCELSGLDTPAHFDGVSLVGDLKQGCQTLPQDRPQICEDYHVRSIVIGSGKLVWDLNVQERQYYDLSEDPYCYHNLYRANRYAGEVAERKRQLIIFLCRHIFGCYSEQDVANIRARLHAAPDKIGICLSDKQEFDFFRCAAFMRNGTRELFVPFYDAEMLLWERKGDWQDNYPREANALAMDFDEANALLDELLVRLYRLAPSVSLFRLPRVIPDEILNGLAFSNPAHA